MTIVPVLVFIIVLIIRVLCWQELKANFETFEMLRPGILEKVVKNFSVRKGDP